MKRWRVIGFAAAWLAAGGAWAADWRESFRPLAAGKFSLPRPQVGDYRFGWSGLTAAEAHIEFTRPAPNELQLKLTMRTIGPARALWQMDAEHTSRCLADSLRPIDLDQVERYRREVEITRAIFDPTGVLREIEHQPPPRKPSKPKHFDFVGLHDMHTALLAVRSQPLKAGDRYTLVVYPGRDPYLVQAEVLTREELSVPARKGPAVKLKVELERLDKKLQRQPYKKFRNAQVWLSDDADRLLLKIKSEVFVGSVWMELRSVKFTD